MIHQLLTKPTLTSLPMRTTPVLPRKPLLQKDWWAHLAQPRMPSPLAVTTLMTALNSLGARQQYRHLVLLGLRPSRLRSVTYHAIRAQVMRETVKSNQT